MKIKLIEPTRYLADGSLLKTKQMLYPATTMPLLAALAPREASCSIVFERLQQIDLDEPCDLVAITSNTVNIQRAYDLADEYRRRRVPVVMGGVHVTMLPDEALEHADAVVVGEAEETWPQAIRDFQAGKLQRLYRDTVKPSLAGLPVPRLDLLPRSGFMGWMVRGTPVERYTGRYMYFPMIPIMAGRGCPHGCDFCVPTVIFGRRYRPRPVADVVNEIKALGAGSVVFQDDNIFGDRAHARELLEALIPLRISWMGQGTINMAEDLELMKLARRSGCFMLYVGLETLSPHNLHSVAKKTNRVEHYERNLQALRKLGIQVCASMMFGLEDDEPEVFRRTYEFAVRQQLALVVWWHACPLPGTVYYQRLKDAGRLKDERWWLRRDLYTQAWGRLSTSEKISDSDFSKSFYQYFRKLYSPAAIARRVVFPPHLAAVPLTFLNLYMGAKTTPAANPFEL